MATTKTNKKTTKIINRKKALTKGLDEIFGEDILKVINDVQATTKSSPEEEISENSVQILKIAKIVPNPHQPRRVFDKEKLKELSNSIKENGLLTPIVVKKSKTGTYYIVAGERRYRSSKLANKATIKAIVIDVSDRKMQELALIENIQREDLNPIEEAVAVKQLIDDYKMTHEQASKILGKSRVYITNSLRLLKLESRIIDSVLSGNLTFGHAKPLISLEQKNARTLFERILSEGLTVREVENIARGYKLSEFRKGATKKKPIRKSAALENAEDLLRNKVKTKVEITDRKIIIKYKGNEQLNRILGRIDALEK